MANRIRRTNQPPETKLRMEPHRVDRHHRRPNLVRTWRLRAQPRQDQRARSMITHPAAASTNPPGQTGQTVDRYHRHELFFRSYFLVAEATTENCCFAAVSV